MIPYNTIWAIEDGAFSHVSSLISNYYALDEKAIMGLLASNQSPVYESHDDTATIHVRGPLVKNDDFFALLSGGTTYASIADAANRARADKKVRNVVLAVDSPGGTVDGVTMATKALAGLRSDKSVVGYVDGLAASAGLWVLTAGADKIIGTDTSRMGSIGVKKRLIDVSAKLEKEGIKIHNIASGPMKAGGDMGEKISEETIAEAQRHVDEFNEMFIKSVASGRGATEDQIRALATGSLFTHSEGLSNGLMDKTGTTADLSREFEKLNIGERLKALGA
jgi:signal peptide peptidase SppA